MTVDEPMDCLVVGAGPGGLTSAIYLARYLRELLVVDDGRSRTLWIPRSHNCPGYPDGISGADLLDRLRRQAGRYGVPILQDRLDSLERRPDGGFAARIGDRTVLAKAVVVATGVQDVEPPLPDLDQGIRRGLVRHCPTCDAYEIRDRRVAIMGEGTCRWREAMLLRSYTSDLTVLSLRRPLELAAEERTALADAGVQLVDEPVGELEIGREAVAARLAQSGRVLHFDTLYTALGLRGRSDLALRLGADHDEDGMLLADEHQRTSVPGLYGVGDVVRGLTQIGVAMGQAAIAATAINNTLETRLRPQQPSAR